MSDICHIDHIGFAACSLSYSKVFCFSSRSRGLHLLVQSVASAMHFGWASLFKSCIGARLSLCRGRQGETNKPSHDLFARSFDTLKEIRQLLFLLCLSFPPFPEP